jgi:hypothetical protein
MSLFNFTDMVNANILHGKCIALLRNTANLNFVITVYCNFLPFLSLHCIKLKLMQGFLYISLFLFFSFLIVSSSFFEGKLHPIHGPDTFIGCKNHVMACYEDCRIYPHITVTTSLLIIVVVGFFCQMKYQKSDTYRLN